MLHGGQATATLLVVGARVCARGLACFGLRDQQQPLVQFCHVLRVRCGKVRLCMRRLVWCSSYAWQHQRRLWAHQAEWQRCLVQRAALAGVPSCVGLARASTARLGPPSPVSIHTYAQARVARHTHRVVQGGLGYVGPNREEHAALFTAQTSLSAVLTQHCRNVRWKCNVQHHGHLRVWRSVPHCVAKAPLGPATCAAPMAAPYPSPRYHLHDK